ncbi:hypothetical protein Q6286_25465, partial [Klebsiella pneumoniae]|uniref:hypothetical protein n=1 Tax=Klebsiella pneumoniae TaxID=573 RepID=UPI00272F49B5
MHRAAAWLCDLFPDPLEQRVKTLYPYAEQTMIDTYLQTLADPLQRQRFEARELEKDELHRELTQWITHVPDDEPAVIGEQR